MGILRATSDSLPQIGYSHYMRPSLHVQLAVVFLLAGFSCGDDPTEPPPSAPSWKVQRAAGGILTLSDVWGSSGSDVFAVGSASTVLHQSGAGWNPMSIGAGGPVLSVWGSSGTDVYAIHVQVGSMDIIHYDGNGWEPSLSLGGFFSEQAALWGSSESDIFAVGLHPDSILHYDGNSWKGEYSGTTSLLADVWGSSAQNVYAVGLGGALVHYDGDEWSSVPSGTDKDLASIGGSAADDIRAVGRDGAVVVYGISGWNPEDIGTTAHLTGVWSSSASDVFVTGAYLNGTVFHYNGAEWSPVFTPQERLYAVWGTSPTDVFVVGSGGLIVHYGQND